MSYEFEEECCGIVLRVISRTLNTQSRKLEEDAKFDFQKVSS